MSSDLTQLKEQWARPSNLLGVLMIIGADIVQRALAQLSGGTFTPVSFSFGWVAYSFNALVLAVGDNRLMPACDCPSIVINAHHGYVRDNRSWILGRIIRDFDYWKPAAVEDAVQKSLKEANEADKAAAKAKAANSNSASEVMPPRRQRAGLCVSVFRTSSDPAGVPAHDWVFYSGILVAILQLLIAIIPVIMHNNWWIFIITGSGILLAFMHGALPQWKSEKWHCRRQEKDVILTTGNGAQHAIVILGDKDALDLEDLAAGERSHSSTTRICTVLLAGAWLVLLITVGGITHDPWFLMAVGGIGMVQNVVVAGAPRRPEAFGIHLDLDGCISHRKAMEALMAVEEKYPRVGSNLLATFFPGKLREDETEFWERKAKGMVEEKKPAESRASPEITSQPQPVVNNSSGSSMV